MLPFILPETNKDTLDDMDTNECDISSSALPGDHNESMDSYVNQNQQLDRTPKRNLMLQRLYCVHLQLPHVLLPLLIKAVVLPFSPGVA